TPRSVAHRSTGSFEQSWDFLPHLESICGKTTKKYVDSNGNSRPQPQHRGPPTTKSQPSTERTISRCESSTPGNSDARLCWGGSLAPGYGALRARLGFGSRWPAMLG